MDVIKRDRDGHWNVEQEPNASFIEPLEECDCQLPSSESIFIPSLEDNRNRPVRIILEGDTKVVSRGNGIFSIIKDATIEDVENATFKSNCLLAALRGYLKYKHFYWGCTGKGRMPHFAWENKYGFVMHFIKSPINNKKMNRWYYFIWFDGVVSEMSESEIRLWHMKKII